MRMRKAQPAAPWGPEDAPQAGTCFSMEIKINPKQREFSMLVTARRFLRYLHHRRAAKSRRHSELIKAALRSRNADERRTRALSLLHIPSLAFAPSQPS